MIVRETNSVLIDRAAHHVWDLLERRFAEISAWAAGVQESRAIHDPTFFKNCIVVRNSQGQVGRVLRTGFGRTIDEAILYCDQKSRILETHITGKLLFTKSLYTRWHVVGTPAATKVEFQCLSYISNAWALFPHMHSRYLSLINLKILRDLKVYMECDE